MSAIKDKLQYLLGERGLTQKQLASATGASTTTVNGWFREVGATKPSFDNILPIARAFDVPVEYLLDETLDEPPKRKPESKATVALQAILERIEPQEAIDRLMLKDFNPKALQERLDVFSEEVGKALKRYLDREVFHPATKAFEPVVDGPKPRSRNKGT